MKRKGFYFMLLTFCFLLTSVSFSFAQNTGDIQCEENPPVCSVSPKEFGYYVDFVKEILATINTVQGKGKKLGEYNYIGGLFTNKILEIPGENKSIFEKMVAGLEQSMSRKISTTLGVTSILSSLVFTSYKDFIGLSILFQSRPIVREWKTLLDLETSINQVVYELSVSAMYNEAVVDSTKFQEIIDKYTRDKPLFLEGRVFDNTKYKDITNMLIRLNGAMKTFMPYGKINQFDEFSRGGPDGIYLKFNTSTISEMKSAYSCARWFKCSNTLKDFLNNTKILSVLKKGGSDAKDKIVEANQRLAKSVKGIPEAKPLKKSPGEEYLTDTEIELLRDVYGMDTSKLTKQEGIGLRDLLSIGSKETLNTAKIKSQGNDDKFLDKQAKTNANVELQESNLAKVDPLELEQLLKENEIKLKEKIKADSSESIIVDPNLEQYFKDVINIVNKQQQNDLAVLWSTSSVDYLAYYTNIGYRIRDVVNIVGNKDKNMVKNLGNICEIQCSNKGIQGCYAN